MHAHKLCIYDMILYTKYIQGCRKQSYNELKLNWTGEGSKSSKI